MIRIRSNATSDCHYNQNDTHTLRDHSVIFRDAFHEMTRNTNTEDRKPNHGSDYDKNGTKGLNPNGVSALITR